MRPIDIDAGILDEQINDAEQKIVNEFDNGDGTLKIEGVKFRMWFIRFKELIDKRGELFLEQQKPVQGTLFF